MCQSSASLDCFVRQRPHAPCCLPSLPELDWRERENARQGSRNLHKTQVAKRRNWQTNTTLSLAPTGLAPHYIFFWRVFPRLVSSLRGGHHVQAYFSPPHTRLRVGSLIVFDVLWYKALECFTSSGRALLACESKADMNSGNSGFMSHSDDERLRHGK